jgi:hypothetical protein
MTDQDEIRVSSIQSGPRTTAAADVVTGWKWLYRMGGVAALLAVVVTLLHSGVYAVVGLPTTAPEWFALFQSNALGGLLAFELLMVLYVLLYVPVVLALYVALRRASPSLTVVFVALSLIGVVAFIVARPAIEMLTLSDAHAAATTDAHRASYLAAGEATLAVFHGTAFWVSYLLGSISGLILAAVMLRTSIFSRSTAYLRIASSVLDFGLFVPAVGLYLALGSVLCLMAFNILVARRLLQLGRRAANESEASNNPSRGRSTVALVVDPK